MKGAKLLTRKRFIGVLAAFAAVFAASIVIAPLFGPTRVSLKRALEEIMGAGAATFSDADVVFFLRMPRVLLAALAGGALALVGAVFQALLRNPLATPYTMGVAGGGALGAVIAISFAPLLREWGPFSTLQFFALAGALVNISIVYLLARKSGHFTTTGLLLAGVTLALLSTALILCVRLFTSPFHLVAVDRWMMGGVQVVGYRQLASLVPLLFPGVAVLLGLSREFDQLAFGEELAAGRGVNVGAVKVTAFFAGSLVTAAAVSVVGPIGFVGLLVPHSVRRIVGPDHRLLLPASFLAGGAFLVVADTAARTLASPMELPVGILTALMGGPFFLWLLTRSRPVDQSL